MDRDADVASPATPSGFEEPGQLSLNYVFDAEGGAEIHTLQVSGKGSKIRVSFAEGSTNSAVFLPLFSRYFDDLLRLTEGHCGVTALSDRSLHHPQLILASPRVLVTRPAPERLHAVVRFPNCTGDVLRMFRPGVLPNVQIGSAIDRLALDTIGDVFVPLSNLSTYIRHRIENSDPSDREASIEALKTAAIRIDALRADYALLRGLVDSHDIRDDLQTPARLARISA